MWRRGVLGGIIGMLATAFAGPRVDIPLGILLVVILIISPNRAWILTGVLVGVSMTFGLLIGGSAISCQVDPTCVRGATELTTPILFVAATGVIGLIGTSLLWSHDGD